MAENILVFKRSVLDELGSFQGTLSPPQSDRYIKEVLNPLNWMFHSRPEAENDPSLKQIIPYCVLTRGSKIYYYQRTKKAGEARLHDLYSVGFGGHINDQDVKNGKITRQLYFDALHRELEEEIDMNGAMWVNKIGGIINDDSNMVGQVHFGIVHRLVLVTDGYTERREKNDKTGEMEYVRRNTKEISLKEDAHRNLQCDDLSVLKAKIASGEMVFENWSKLVLENLL